MIPINFKFSGFLKVLVPFVLVQFLGIFAAYKFLPEVIYARPVSWNSFSFYDILFLVLFTVIFIFVASRYQKFGTIFYKVFLTLIMFAGVQTILGIWLNPTIVILLTILLIFLFWFFQNVFLHDILMVITIAGIGSVLGISFAPAVILLILVAFSFYDIIAVYKTGHMVKLTESMIRSRAIFGFIIPNSSKGWTNRLSEVFPGEQFMILGSGDIIFPLLLSASLVRTSLAQAVTVGIFSAIGLLLMYWLFSRQKIRRPMAALPPIAGTAIIGYLMAALIFK